MTEQVEKLLAGARRNAMRHRVVGWLILAGALAGVPALAAQASRPRAEVAPVVTTARPKAGGPLLLALHVRLPKDVHVQANKPRDPSLIPTVLTLTPPEGMTVDDISYPAPSELAQKDRKETLAVLGPEFTIAIKATLAARHSRRRDHDPRRPPLSGLQRLGLLRPHACHGRMGGPRRVARRSQA